MLFGFWLKRHIVIDGWLEREVFLGDRQRLFEAMFLELLGLFLHADAL